MTDVTTGRLWSHVYGATTNEAVTNQDDYNHRIAKPDTKNGIEERYRGR